MVQNSAFSTFCPIAFFGVTSESINILETLQKATDGVIYCPKKLAERSTNKIEAYENSLSEQVTKIWQQYNALVFCLATGAVVRTIAPLLTNKEEDPAIIAIEPTGEYVISLCGGHQSNGDLLTTLIAQQLSATPIITGASRSLNSPTTDLLGKPFGWQKGKGDWTKVMAAVANNQPVEIMQIRNKHWKDSSINEGQNFCYLLSAAKNN